MDFAPDSYTAPEEPVKTWPTRAIGAGVVAVCILLILSLLTYNIGEMGWSALNPRGHEAAEAVPCTNILGTIGLYLAGMLYALLGAAAVYTLLLLGILGASMIIRPQQKRLGQWVAFLVMMICACAFLGIQDLVWVEWAEKLCLKSPGGLLGYFDGVCVAEPLLTARWAMVLMVAGHGAALIYFARETPGTVGYGLRDDLKQLWRYIQEKRRIRREAQQNEQTNWVSESTLQPNPTQQPDLSLFTTPASLPEDEPEQRPAQQGQLPPRVRPNIQTAPPPVRQHEVPAPRPAIAPRRLRPEPAAENTPAPVITPTPAPPRRISPAPMPRIPAPVSSGDNLLDLMPEVEDEIVRSNSSAMEDEMTPSPSPRNNRSSMPLSPAAQAAFDRFRGIASMEDEADEDTPALNMPGFSPEEEPDDIDTPPPAHPLPAPIRRTTPPMSPVVERPASDPLGIVERLRKARSNREAEQPEDTRDMLEDYPLPPYDLLHYRPPADEDTAAAREEMFATQQNIIETLASFRIDVEEGDITRGPSITRYEFYPPKGLKLNRITNLADNLRMATQSKSINILAPIPGKNTVGIELENDIKSPVFLRELLQSEAFHSPKLRIPVALGKDVYGAPVIGDLAAMPHTLVAGTTGSGKSVCVNSMILSMLYKFRPDELRLILVDPKVVEMQPYKKLPHLACPVVTNAARVIGALRWAVNEMEHRYKLFSKIGVRNFEDFNNRPEDFEPEPEEEESREQYTPLPEGYDAADAIVRDIEESQGSEYLPEEEEQGEFDFEADERIPAKLPYIVIIIDELADLMMQVKEDLENYIARLTQKARAAGIHLVAATQTPRANVITGIIKANIPSRLAFKVASPLDSRVILDTNGAENLLGKGDFLFLPPGGITKMTRAQGAFVSDPEIASIVKFCASHAKQNFVQGVTAEMNNAEGGCADGASDGGGRLGGNGMNDEDAELYTRCVNLVITERKASTSMLQRRFSIGYGRAAKMMDMMEARGVIGPASGNTARPREVLIEAPQ
ncbi:MAG: DNA translocase FtsK [Akkermansia sp.]|nr:DNA translocase FtsK [Akkermansia sp.]